VRKLDQINAAVRLDDLRVPSGNRLHPLGVSRQTVNELVRERCSVSPEMALRLSVLFGNSAEFWLHLQRAVDLWDAQAAAGDDLRRIKPLRVA
jgi:addiction module HigA family antidote